MDWDTASNWVSTLNVGGFTDWRLPSDDDFWPWFKNELCDYSDPANPHLLSSPFTNIQFGDSSPVVSYWTSNLTLVVDSGMSWWDADAFWPYKGYFPGFPIDPNDGYWVYVWPVRTGDVIVPVTRPILRIFQTTINDVVLAWPTNSIGFTLQRNTSLATTNWTSVTNVIRVNGTNNQVSIALVSSNTFFRLTHP
jgi:hypothetical protein